jgi:putative tricarboxylic transport membrane protein
MQRRLYETKKWIIALYSAITGCVLSKTGRGTEILKIMTVKKTYRRLCNSLWLLTSLVICVASIQLNLGTLRDPGPGLMPFGTGLFLFFFSLPALFRRDSEEESEAGPWVGPYWKRVVATVLSLSAYGLLLTRLGYLIATFLLMIFLFRSRESRGWAAIIIKSALSAVITYVVFDKWLDCQLPKGLFGF